MKMVCASFLCLLLLFLLGCNTSPADELLEEDTGLETRPEFLDDTNIHSGLDIESETDYSNITAATEQPTYDKTVDEIKVNIQNNTVGKGFYVHSNCYVEKKEGEKWIEVHHEYRTVAEWMFAGVEGNTDEPNRTVLMVRTEYLEDKLEPGDYRVVVYLKDRAIFAPFTIT